MSLWKNPMLFWLILCKQNIKNLKFSSLRKTYFQILYFVHGFMKFQNGMSWAGISFILLWVRHLHFSCRIFSWIASLMTPPPIHFSLLYFCNSCNLLLNPYGGLLSPIFVFYLLFISYFISFFLLYVFTSISGKISTTIFSNYVLGFPFGFILLISLNFFSLNFLYIASCSILGRNNLSFLPSSETYVKVFSSLHNLWFFSGCDLMVLWPLFVFVWPLIFTLKIFLKCAVTLGYLTTFKSVKLKGLYVEVGLGTCNLIPSCVVWLGYFVECVNLLVSPKRCFPQRA